MKSKKNIVFAIVAIVLIIASFFAGGYVKKQEYGNTREQRCGTLISFALDKAENGDVSDPDTMKALISNIYAAYELCDDPVLQNQLHDLWNELIFDGDDYVAIKNNLIVELQSVSDAIKTD